MGIAIMKMLKTLGLMLSFCVCLPVFANQANFERFKNSSTQIIDDLITQGFENIAGVDLRLLKADMQSVNWHLFEDGVAGGSGGNRMTATALASAAALAAIACCRADSWAAILSAKALRSAALTLASSLAACSDSTVCAITLSW